MWQKKRKYACPPDTRKIMISSVWLIICFQVRFARDGSNQTVVKFKIWYFYINGQIPIKAFCIPKNNCYRFLKEFKYRRWIAIKNWLRQYNLSCMSPIIKAAETKIKKKILSKWYKCSLIDQVSITGIPMTHNLHKALPDSNWRSTI